MKKFIISLMCLVSFAIVAKGQSSISAQDEYRSNLLDIAIGRPIGTGVKERAQSAQINRNMQELDRKDREQVAWALAWRANASDDPQERNKLARVIQMQLPHLTGLDADTTIFAIIGPEYYRAPLNANIGERK